MVRCALPGHAENVTSAPVSHRGVHRRANRSHRARAPIRVVPSRETSKGWIDGVPADANVDVDDTRSQGSTKVTPVRHDAPRPAVPHHRDHRARPRAGVQAQVAPRSTGTAETVRPFPGGWPGRRAGSTRAAGSPGRPGAAPRKDPPGGRRRRAWRSLDPPLAGGGVGLLHDADQLGAFAEDPAVPARVAARTSSGSWPPTASGDDLAAGPPGRAPTCTSGSSPPCTRTSSDARGGRLRSQHRVAGAQRCALVHEDAARADGPSERTPPRRLAVVAEHHHDPRAGGGHARLEHVPQRGPPADVVQHLRQRRPHAHALAGGQHDQGQATGGSGCGHVDPYVEAGGGSPSTGPVALAKAAPTGAGRWACGIVAAWSLWAFVQLAGRRVLVPVIRVRIAGAQRRRRSWVSPVTTGPTPATPADLRRSPSGDGCVGPLVRRKQRRQRSARSPQEATPAAPRIRSTRARRRSRGGDGTPAARGRCGAAGPPTAGSSPVGRAPRAAISGIRIRARDRRRPGPTTRRRRRSVRRTRRAGSRPSERVAGRDRLDPLAPASRHDGGPRHAGQARRIRPPRRPRRAGPPQLRGDPTTGSGRAGSRPASALPPPRPASAGTTFSSAISANPRTPARGGQRLGRPQDEVRAVDRDAGRPRGRRSPPGKGQRREARDPAAARITDRSARGTGRISVSIS